MLMEANISCLTSERWNDAYKIIPFNCRFFFHKLIQPHCNYGMCGPCQGTGKQLFSNKTSGNKKSYESKWDDLCSILKKLNFLWKFCSIFTASPLRHGYAVIFNSLRESLRFGGVGQIGHSSGCGFSINFSFITQNWYILHLNNTIILLLIWLHLCPSKQKTVKDCSR